MAVCASVDAPTMTEPVFALLLCMLLAHCQGLLCISRISEQAQLECVPPPLPQVIASADMA